MQEGGWFEFDPPLAVLLADATRPSTEEEDEEEEEVVGGKGWLTVTDDRCPESNTYTPLVGWWTVHSVLEHIYVTFPLLPPFPPPRYTNRDTYTRLLYTRTIVIRGCTGHGYAAKCHASYPPVS